MSNDNLRNRQPNVIDVTACTCANLRRATRLVTQAFDTALQPAGLRATQFTLLASLAKLGDIPLTRLAKTLTMDRTTLTRNLKPLLGKGWVRVEQEADQRVRRIHLTEEGLKVFEEALPYWQETQIRLVEGLGQERWSSLLDELAHTVALMKSE